MNLFLTERFAKDGILGSKPFSAWILKALSIVFLLDFTVANGMSETILTPPSFDIF